MPAELLIPGLATKLKAEQTQDTERGAELAAEGAAELFPLGHCCFTFCTAAEKWALLPPLRLLT